jgi:hypothetical protein
MKPRVLWISGTVAVVLAVGAWLGLRSTPNHPATAATHADDTLSDPLVAAPPVAAADTPPVATVATAATAAPSASGAAAAPVAPAAPISPDERTVLDMFQNMTDAVDAYGPDACPALGQAFNTFVNDALPAVRRLVQISKAKGENFNDAFAAAHGAQLTTTQDKLKEAVTRCGTDSGVINALQTLAKQH